MNRPVLIVEDSEFDAASVIRTFINAGIHHPIIHYDNGDDAYDYLIRCNRPHAPLDQLPILILLDLNLPGMEGLELLHFAKRANRLKLIPVVMLSTSANTTEIERCYKLGANSFITKSASETPLDISIVHLYDYWFNTATVPKHPY